MEHSLDHERSILARRLYRGMLVLETFERPAAVPGQMLATPGSRHANRARSRTIIEVSTEQKAALAFNLSDHLFVGAVKMMAESATIPSSLRRALGRSLAVASTSLILIVQVHVAHAT